MMSHDGNQIKVSFCPIPSSEVQEEIILVSVSNTNTGTNDTTESTTKESGKRSKFGPQPNLTVLILTLRRNWINFLFQLTLEKWS